MPAPALARVSTSGPVHYPDSDGLPMADNTVQYRWMVTIKENLDALLPDFVAANLLWYPVEGDPRTRQAPDVMVAIGRPKGDRGSYRQWEEAGVAPQVVFEVLSPGNTFPEMVRKALFYERYGVEEYYIYDPEVRVLSAWVREGGRLRDVEQVDGWTSPRLGIRFRHGEDLEIVGPDGRRFLTFGEVKARADEAERKLLVEVERAEAEKQRAEAEKQRADALADRLRELGVDPDAP